MRRSLSLLVALACSAVAIPSFADEPAAPSPEETRTAPVSNAGGAIAPSNDRGLAQIHSGTTSQSAASSGRLREVELAADKAKTSRPVATPRALRKMNADRAMAAVEPQIRACATASTATSPTTFPIRLSVSPTGEVESSELASGGRAPAPVLACVVQALGKARFASPGAAGASLVLPVTVPARPAPRPEPEVADADAK